MFSYFPLGELLLSLEYNIKMAKTRKTSRMERRWSSLELPAEKGITPNLVQKICSKLICFNEFRTMNCSKSQAIQIEILQRGLLKI